MRERERERESNIEKEGDIERASARVRYRAIPI